MANTPVPVFTQAQLGAKASNCLNCDEVDACFANNVMNKKSLTRTKLEALIKTLLPIPQIITGLEIARLLFGSTDARNLLLKGLKVVDSITIIGNSLKVSYSDGTFTLQPLAGTATTCTPLTSAIVTALTPTCSYLTGATIT